MGWWLDVSAWSISKNTNHISHFCIQFWREIYEKLKKFVNLYKNYTPWDPLCLPTQITNHKNFNYLYDHFIVMPNILHLWFAFWGQLYGAKWLNYETTKPSDSISWNRKTCIHECNIKGTLHCLQCEQITVKVKDKIFFKYYNYKKIMLD